MTAWAILTGNSTAPVGSIAWVHLNNQAGGGSGVIYDGTKVSLNSAYKASLNAGYKVSLNKGFKVKLNKNITVQIDSGHKVNLENPIKVKVCR